jgi:SAM-dependent methyltransferase
MRRALLACLALLLPWQAGLATARDVPATHRLPETQPAPATQGGPGYEPVAPTADGIGKRYMGRHIARVMGVGGAPWLERPEREREEQGERMLAALGLRPGMVVADVGAGTGYHSRRIARRVGPAGIVYAVDVQPGMLQEVRARATAEGIANVRTVLAGTRALNLPPRSVDLALMVDVYHELEFPLEVLQDLVRAMKPGGRIVFVEYRAEDARVPIRPLHRMSLAQVKREAAAAGLRWQRTIDVLPWQHIVVFTTPAG